MKILQIKLSTRKEKQKIWLINKTMIEKKKMNESRWMMMWHYFYDKKRNKKDNLKNSCVYYRPWDISSAAPNPNDKRWKFRQTENFHISVPKSEKVQSC